MLHYHNTMEQLVEQRFTELAPTLGCCTCEICRNDIIAYALNHLPCKYVVSNAGVVYSKLFSLSQQHDTDIVAAITLGANTVRDNPRHSFYDHPDEAENDSLVQVGKE